MSEDVCSVCWDTFRCPKLLPCKHAFCISCLYEYRDRLSDKSNMICPLCREPCFVPDKGDFEKFPTNYFAEAKKIEKQCQECEKASVSKVCHRCYSFLCFKCFLVHSHIKGSSDEDDDQNIMNSSSLSSLRTPPGTKTELICEQIMIFLPEFLPSQNETRSIRSLSFSHSGGVYVNQPGSNYLLKSNKHGKLIGKIPLVLDDVSGVVETRSGILLIAHFLIRSVVCYGDGSPNFERFYFAKTPSFHPLGLAELSNENIVIGGPTHLCGSLCKKNNEECEIEPKSYGVIQIVSKTGVLIKEIKDDGEYINKFPIYIASSCKFHTFAVCDKTQKTVVIYDNNGELCSIFKGTDSSQLLFLVQLETLMPTAVCTTSDGNYVVSDPRLPWLYVLNPYGKYIGILRCKNGDDLAHTGALCIDSENNIWVGHKLQGTITVLKTKYFKNVLDFLPSLPFLGNGLDFSGLGNGLDFTGLGNIDWLQLLAADIADP